MMFTKTAATEEVIGVKNNPINSDVYVVQTAKTPANLDSPPPKEEE